MQFGYWRSAHHRQQLDKLRAEEFRQAERLRALTEWAIIGSGIVVLGILLIAAVWLTLNLCWPPR